MHLSFTYEKYPNGNNNNNSNKVNKLQEPIGKIAMKSIILTNRNTNNINKKY